MRIVYTSFFRRLFHNIKEPSCLKVAIVGTSEDLEKLTKMIEKACGES